MKSDPKNLGEEIKMQVTGTKNPSRKKWMYALLAVFIISLIVTTIQFYQSDFLAKFTAKADVDIVLPLYPNDDGTVTVTVQNIGERKLTNLAVNIKSCYAEGYKWMRIPELNIGKEVTFLYEDEKTKQTMLRLDCQDPDAYLAEPPNMEIGFFKNKTTSERLGPIPKQHYEFLACGECYWRISVESDQLKKTFDSSTKFMTAPVTITGDITSDGARDYSGSPDVETIKLLRIKIFDGDTWQKLLSKYPQGNQTPLMEKDGSR